MENESERIKTLENWSLAYKIIGGISIVVIIILVGVVIYMFIHLRKINSQFTQKMNYLERLGRFTIKRPQVNHSSLSLVQNRFRTNETSSPTLFDTSVNQQQPSQNNLDYKQEIARRQSLAPGSNALNNMAKNPSRSDSFLHRESDRDGPVFGNW